MIFLVININEIFVSLFFGDEIRGFISAPTSAIVLLPNTTNILSKTAIYLIKQNSKKSDELSYYNSSEKNNTPYFNVTYACFLLFSLKKGQIGYTRELSKSNLRKVIRPCDNSISMKFKNLRVIERNKITQEENREHLNGSNPKKPIVISSAP